MIRRVEGGRLVYYKLMADAAYWDEHWDKLIRPEYYGLGCDVRVWGHLGPGLVEEQCNEAGTSVSAQLLDISK